MTRKEAIKILEIKIPSRPCVAPCYCHIEPCHAGVCYKHTSRWGKVFYKRVLYCGSCFSDLKLVALKKLVGKK